MTLYRYEAFAEDGKKVHGIIDADSYELAKDRLRRQQILLIDLFQVKGDKKEVFLDAKLILSFTREMQLLLRAGLPVYESLVTIEEKYKKTKVHSLFLDLCDRLKHGHLLSAALKNYPKTFDEIYLCLIQAGEQTGELAFVFEELYLLISRKQKLKKQLVGSLVYPAFLGAFCLIVLFSMLFFVVPSMKELFEGRALHPLTEAVLWLSEALTRNIFLLGSLLTAAVTGFVVFMKREEGKKFFQNLLLKIPLSRNLILHSALIRFSRALSILLKGGVPLLKSIDLARRVLHLVSLEIFMQEVMKKISEGKSLSSEIKHEQIPSMIPRMLKTAEDTGRMPEMLQSIAEIYEEELEKNLQLLTTFLQPVLLIFLGATVGIILLSILLPLTDVSSFLSS